MHITFFFYGADKPFGTIQLKTVNILIIFFSADKLSGNLDLLFPPSMDNPVSNSM